MDLKALALKKSITQLEVAKALGISKSGVCHWFNDRRMIAWAHLEKLSALLGVSEKRLIKHNVEISSSVRARRKGLKS